MSIFWHVCFYLSAACVVYPYVVYPLILTILARLRERAVRRDPTFRPSVSVVIAAYNEEAAIGRCLKEVSSLVSAGGVEAEIIVVSDGSTDATAEIVRSFPSEIVRLIEIYPNEGKAVSLTRGCEAAQNDVLVFADVRQTWAEDSLGLLLENFADADVGAVSGDLVIETRPGNGPNDVGIYWKYEKELRKLESRVYSSVGVTGSICAVRRELFRPIPPGTILDDVYWPLQIAMQGYRVIHDERAHAYDYLPDRQLDEFWRKLRTLSGNFQLIARLPAALVPWSNPIWFQFFSHKFLRLITPWGLLGLLASSAVLGGPVFETIFWSQVVVYGVALVGLSKTVRKHFRIASLGASLLVLNTAAWLSFWMWISGRAGKTWKKVKYAGEIGAAKTVS
jgi:biofilm PGA synthesis N-glycosyltransferase PgaC